MGTQGGGRAARGIPLEPGLTGPSGTVAPGAHGSESCDWGTLGGRQDWGGTGNAGHERARRF